MARPRKEIKKRIEDKHFDLEVIKKLAMHGLTDAELANILDVTEQTINRWKQDKEFMLALKNGKTQSDLEVEKSLYKRATGFEYEETTVEGSQKDDGTYKTKTVKKTKKYYPPDTAAAFIWLKNRRGWRDRQEVEHTGGVKIIKDDI